MTVDKKAAEELSDDELEQVDGGFSLLEAFKQFTERAKGAFDENVGPATAAPLATGTSVASGTAPLATGTSVASGTAALGSKVKSKFE